MNKNNIPYFNEIYAMYPYGSRVYGTFRPDSDYDYIVILNTERTQEQIIKNKDSFNIISKKEFQIALNNHETWALECYFLPESQVVIKPKEPWNFIFSVDKLKTYFIQKMNQEWLKSETKFSKQNILAAKKSLFHAFRVGLFGLQILKYNKLVNYEEANPLWNFIINQSKTNWNYYKLLLNSSYEKLKNNLHNSIYTLDIKEIVPYIPIVTKRRIYTDSKND